MMDGGCKAARLAEAGPPSNEASPDPEIGV